MYALDIFFSLQKIDKYNTHFFFCFEIESRPCVEAYYLLLKYILAYLVWGTTDRISVSVFGRNEKDLSVAPNLVHRPAIFVSL